MNNVLLSQRARSAFLFAKDSPASLQCPSSSLSPEIAPPRRRPSPSLRFVRSATKGPGPLPCSVRFAGARGSWTFLRSLLQQNRVFGSLFLVSARFEDARLPNLLVKRQVACFPLWTEKGSVCQTGDFAAHELPDHARPKPAPCARSGRLPNVSRETFAREQGVQAGRQDRTKKSARNQLVPGALRFWRRR